MSFSHLQGVEAPWTASAGGPRPFDRYQFLH